MISETATLPDWLARIYPWSDNKTGWQIDTSEDWYDGKQVSRVDYDWLSVHSNPEEAVLRFRPIYRRDGKEWYGSWEEVYYGHFVVAT